MTKKNRNRRVRARRARRKGQLFSYLYGGPLPKGISFIIFDEAYFYRRNK